MYIQQQCKEEPDYHFTEHRRMLACITEGEVPGMFNVPHV